MAGQQETEAKQAAGYRPWWAIDKEAWKRKFSIVAEISSIKEIGPLPKWTEEDVQKFAKEEPVYGDQLLRLRQASQISGIGALVGGLGTSLYSYRYSRSVGGAALVLVFGVTASYALSEEAANLGLGLYKFDAMETNFKFLHWWKAQSKQ
eukprot:TRINITY_DN8673_c0_g1_i1.p1 TRINITY_DN8673_c0_g1~~TRINITY_DN8673_c0_g1_i1.p1  ORF type:complete len:150 (+),score=32.32 TRINITY_DN8673_c0_g1_i1:240-689(+)